MERYNRSGERVPCTHEHATDWAREKLQAYTRVASPVRTPQELETVAVVNALTGERLCGTCRHATFFTVAVPHTSGSRVELDCAAGANIVGMSQGRFSYEVTCPDHCPR